MGRALEARPRATRLPPGAHPDPRPAMASGHVRAEGRSDRGPFTESMDVMGTARNWSLRRATLPARCRCSSPGAAATAAAGRRPHLWSRAPKLPADPGPGSRRRLLEPRTRFSRSRSRCRGPWWGLGKVQPLRRGGRLPYAARLVPAEQIAWRMVAALVVAGGGDHQDRLAVGRDQLRRVETLERHRGLRSTHVARDSGWSPGMSLVSGTFLPYVPGL